MRLAETLFLLFYVLHLAQERHQSAEDIEERHG